MTEMTKYEPGVFCWVDLMAHDMEAAAKWYAELFGWEYNAQDTGGGPPYGIFTKGGKTVAGIGQMDDGMKKGGVPPVWTDYVNVDDIDAVAAKVEAAGGKVTVPPMQVMEAGWLAFFMDPEGASFAAWKANNHIGAQVVNEHGALSWNELNAKDVDTAKKFYGEVFGWSFEDVPMPNMTYSLAKAGERNTGGIMPMVGPQWEGVPPHWMTYFAVDDCDAMAKRVSDSGGQVCVPPTDIPPGRFAVVNDPQGGTFTLFQMNPDYQPG